MAAKGAVAAGEECLMEKRKRKAAEMEAGDESTPKNKAVVIGCSELNQGAMEAKGEVAPGKKMEKRERKAVEIAAGDESSTKRTRLPQEEIDSILATVMDDDRLPPDFRALKRHSPDLIPSPEEEMDEELVSFYDVVREFYAVGEEFREFQAWVRSEYTKNSYVEVTDEFLARTAEGEAIIEEARLEALKGFDFSGLFD